jgi:hypothetical protein
MGCACSDVEDARDRGGESVLATAAELDVPVLVFEADVLCDGSSKGPCDSFPDMSADGALHFARMSDSLLHLALLICRSTSCTVMLRARHRSGRRRGVLSVRTPS